MEITSVRRMITQNQESWPKKQASKTYNHLKTEGQVAGTNWSWGKVKKRPPKSTPTIGGRMLLLDAVPLHRSGHPWLSDCPIVCLSQFLPPATWQPWSCAMLWLLQKSCRRLAFLVAGGVCSDPLLVDDDWLHFNRQSSSMQVTHHTTMVMHFIKFSGTKNLGADQIRPQAQLLQLWALVRQLRAQGEQGTVDG